jgi:hypothetical protein
MKAWLSAIILYLNMRTISNGSPLSKVCLYHTFFVVIASLIARFVTDMCSPQPFTLGTNHYWNIENKLPLIDLSSSAIMAWAMGTKIILQVTKVRIICLQLSGWLIDRNLWMMIFFSSFQIFGVFIWKMMNYHDNNLPRGEFFFHNWGHEG